MEKTPELQAEAKLAIEEILRICASSGDDHMEAVMGIVDLVTAGDEFVMRLDLKPDHAAQKILAEVYYDKHLMSPEVLKLAVYAMKDFSNKYLSTIGVDNGTMH